MMLDVQMFLIMVPNGDRFGSLEHCGLAIEYGPTTYSMANKQKLCQLKRDRPTTQN
jgi:hypothetical protein